MTPATEVVKRVSLVDVDIHPTMPHQELARRLPRRWAKHVVRAPSATAVAPRARNIGYRGDAWPESGGEPGSDPDLCRAQVLDEYGVDIAILLPLDGCDGGWDPAGFDAARNRALNDWMIEDWLDRDDRFRAGMAVPYDHPAEAVKEIERLADDDRFVTVRIASGTQESLGSRKYWPIYEAAASAGMPVTFHTLGYCAYHGTGWPLYYAEEHPSYALVMQELTTSLVCDGVFAAIPGLRVAIIEGGALWVASLCWRLDAAWRQLHETVPALERLPSEYIHEHVWFDTQPIEETDDSHQFLRLLELGRLEDRLMFATDYPHWDFDSPTNSLPAGLPAALRSKILAGTACELYGLPTRVSPEQHD